VCAVWEGDLKYWMDTEFIEDGKTIDLISIALVCEDGREFYAENLDCDLSKANDWVKENVIAHLWRTNKGENRRTGNVFTRAGGSGSLESHEAITRDVRIFCDPVQYGKPEFWGYYADYDWVVFCQLFGRMIDLPEGFPMYCRDIKQMCDDLGNPELPKQDTTEHHALADARWNKQAWEFLCGLRG
jgi:hypothetical protein